MPNDPSRATHSVEAVTILRAYFEDRAASLADRASVDVVEKAEAVTIRLRPHASTAVGVILHLSAFGHGTVALDDPACAPAELGQDPSDDFESIDYFIRVAVEGRATPFHLGQGGCVEIREGEAISRTWKNALPWPGWRRRAAQVEFGSYS